MTEAHKIGTRWKSVAGEYSKAITSRIGGKLNFGACLLERLKEILKSRSMLCFLVNLAISGGLTI